MTNAEIPGKELISSMDHLPHPSQSAYGHIKVPYLDGFVYDNGGFTEYPSRMGIDKVRLFAGDFDEHSPNILAAFLQSWLFFGMMSEAFGTHVELADFVVDENDGEKFVTTENSLRPYMQRWIKSLEKNANPESQMRIRRCLQEANSFVIYLSGGHLGETYCPLPPEVALSIMVLGATLEASLSHKEKAIDFQIEKKKWGHSPILTERMASIGWCINDIGRISEVGSICLTYFASTVRRELPEGRSHGDCTIQRCVAHHVEEGKYPTKHVSTDCDCKHIKVPGDKVNQILANGGVPIISILLPSGNEEPIIDVVQYRFGIGYCAFSHVWSDGLGNWQQNSLPECQVRRLYDMAGALRGSGMWSRAAFSGIFGANPVHIWIDTLCVPIEKPFRRTAIARMARTYAKATSVLVLDTEIQQLPLGMPAEELLVRISCCGWMRRVWTLLEGSLGSQKLCVQVSGGALGLADLRTQLKSSWRAQLLVTDSIPIDVGLFHYDLEFMRKAFNATNIFPRDINSQSTAFGVALHGFIGRATSWKGDELICLAILLGRTPSAIEILQEVPAEDRDFKLLTLLDNIPHGLLFCQGPKFEQPGYRWMRRDFWRARPYHYYRPARLRPKVGLEITLPGFLIGPILLPRNFFLFENIRNQQWYKATYDSTLPNLRPSSDTLKALDHVPGSSQFGVICPTLNLTRNSPHQLDRIPAALVTIYKNSNRTLNVLDIGRTAIYARYICYVELTLPSTEEIESERSRHEGDWSRYMGQAQKASVHVGESLRNRFRMQTLNEYKEEYLEQTWYVS